MEPKTLDHVAFWVTDREPLVEMATRHLGMHVIDEQENFTLVGSNARLGKLTAGLRPRASPGAAAPRRG